jgi:hypothetical protein
VSEFDFRKQTVPSRFEEVAQKPFVSARAERCEVCSERLSVHEQARGSVCDRPECRQAELKDWLRRQAERERLLRSAVVQYLIQKEAVSGEDELESLSLGVVPANDRSIVNLPERRKRAFRDRLMGIITEAAKRRWGSEGPGSEPGRTVSEREAPVSRALASACATCRGHCCPQGGDHAFLQPETILRVMRDRPDLRPRQILDAYLSRLGTKTYFGSCVFHARSGCRLPRSMRADLCNDYLCKGLNAFRLSLEASASAEGFVAATRDTEVVRGWAIDETGAVDHFTSEGCAGKERRGPS